MLFMSLLVVGGVFAHMFEAGAISYRSWKANRERRKVRRKSGNGRTRPGSCH